MPPYFVDLAERIVDALLESDPSLAHYAGDHRHDGRLPDLSAGGVRRRVAMLLDASNALTEIDADDLDAAERVDHALLTHAVDRALFEATEVRGHEWNPLAHNPGPLLYGLLARPFAPAAERLASLAARLAAVPDALATARDTLVDCPRVHVETAIGQFAGVADLVRDEVPRLLAESPDMAGLVDPARDFALAALAEFDRWLRARLDGPGRDPRLGRRLWEARLWYTLDTELSAAEMLSRAYANLERVTGELADAAAAISPDGPAAALAAVAARHPDDTTIVRLARDALGEATAFVRAHDLVSLVDDELVIQEMPEFARGVAGAYCDAPGPLETAAVPTFYAISPTPADWSAERVASFYREYNDDMLRDMTVHEAMPGHYLQLAHARRYRGSSRVRALCTSGPFVEGWAVYAEELLAAHGFGGAAVRLQQLKMQLRMTINAILDQLVHCEGMTEADGMALMRGRGYQEEGEAAAKWRRALLTATQLSTYFVGYTEVAAIAAARPAGTSEREWHDAMLAHGSPPPRHLRMLLGA